MITRILNPQALPQIEIRFFYSTDGGKTIEELVEGTRLRSSKDRYQIQFTPKEDCFIHVFQVDNQGHVATLKHAKRSVKANETYFLPGKDEYYQLDRTIGPETIYFWAFPFADGAKGPEESIAGRGYFSCAGPPCVKSVTFSTC